MAELLETRYSLNAYEVEPLPNLLEVPVKAFEWFCFQGIREVFDEVFNTDVLIDVPIAKHHGSAILTLGMKNLMGLIRNRSALHTNLGQSIAALNTLIRPTLTVIDAVRILMVNGPSGGNLDDVKKLDTVIASTDIVAADSYATTLFGMRPEDIPYIQAGADMGLGIKDLATLKIEEISLGT